MALTAENQKALDDLGRMWNAANTQQEKDRIHNQANTIRNAGGMKAGVDYDPVSGAAVKSPTSTSFQDVPYYSSLPPGFQYTPQVTPAAQALGERTMGSNNQAYAGQPNQGFTGAPSAGTPSAGTAPVAGKSQSQTTMEYINSILQKNGAERQALMTTLQEQAKAQAQAIAQQKQQAINNLLGSLRSQQKNALQGITNSTSDAKAGLEDSSFQQYLAARQGMANRGLAGSGIASDQDTRLLLSKNRDLSAIFRDAALNTDKVNNLFGQQINQANQSLAEINPDQIQSDIFSQLYKTADTGAMDQAKLYAELFKTMLPYDQASVKDQMDFMLGQGKLNLDQWKAQDGSMLDWAKVGQGDKQLILNQAKIMIDKGQLDLDTWKTLGYMPSPDGSGALVPTGATTQANRTAALEEAKARGFFVGPNGEVIPTEQSRSNQANENLDGKKLIAQITQWEAGNKLEAGRLNLSEAEFGHKVEYDKAMLDKAGAQFSLEKDKVQLDSLQNQLSGVDSQIRTMISSGLEVPPELANARNTLVGQIGSLFRSAPMKTSSSTSSSGTGSLGNSNDGINSQYKTWIEQSGNTGGVKPSVLYAMMLAESSGNPNAVSPVGAKGLMQFMPDTAAGYGVDVNDPHSSIIGATKYMKDLLNMFGNDYEKAVAAYNWGEGNVQRAVQKYGANWKSALPGETKNYLKKVLGG